MKKTTWGTQRQLRADQPLKRTVLTALSFAIALIVTMPSQSAEARSLGTGLAHYADGDYTSAEKALKMALTLENRASERMKIFKLLGISQYMLGKKSHAADNFRMGLRLKPSMTVVANEVVNESVIGFFNSVKSGNFRGSVASTGARMTRVSGSAAPLKVWITSNANRGTISQKGKVIGYINEPLTMPPGFYTLTLKADGYRTKEKIIKVAPNRSARINVKLSPIGGRDDELVASRSSRKSQRAALRDESSDFDSAAFEADPFADMDYLMADDAKFKSRKKARKKSRKKRKKLRKSRSLSQPDTANVSFAFGRKTIRKTAKPVSTPLLFIPFGVGNYFAGSTLKAGLYGSAQLLFLAQFFQAKTRAETFEQKAIDTFQNAQNVSDEDKQQFIIEADKYIKAEKQQANLGLLGFLATWGASAADAYLTRPKSRKRRLTVLAPTQQDFALGSTLHLEEDRSKNQTNLSMGFDPFSQSEVVAETSGGLASGKLWLGLSTEF